MIKTSHTINHRIRFSGVFVEIVSRWLVADARIAILTVCRIYGATLAVRTEPMSFPRQTRCDHYKSSHQELFKPPPHIKMSFIREIMMTTTKRTSKWKSDDQWWSISEDGLLYKKKSQNSRNSREIEQKWKLYKPQYNEVFANPNNRKKPHW